MGQLENRLFSSFSSLKGFDCEALMYVPTNRPHGRMARRLRLATNSA
jgi:hypothetical protein